MFWLYTQYSFEAPWITASMQRGMEVWMLLKLRLLWQQPSVDQVFLIFLLTISTDSLWDPDQASWLYD